MHRVIGCVPAQHVNEHGDVSVRNGGVNTERGVQECTRRWVRLHGRRAPDDIEITQSARCPT
jgi:hypothetical protein